MAFTELKEICNQLIGTWYFEDGKECFTFHLNESLFETKSKLTVINSGSKFKSFNVFYGVGIYIGDLANQERTRFYIDIGSFEKRYYLIEEISKTTLILREYWMTIKGTIMSEMPRTYKRITDLSAADDILKGLDLSE